MFQNTFGDHSIEAAVVHRHTCSTTLDWCFTFFGILVKKKLVKWETGMFEFYFIYIFLPFFRPTLPLPKFGESKEVNRAQPPPQQQQSGVTVAPSAAPPPLQQPPPPAAASAPKQQTPATSGAPSPANVQQQPSNNHRKLSSSEATTQGSSASASAASQDSRDNRQPAKPTTQKKKKKRRSRQKRSATISRESTVAGGSAETFEKDKTVEKSGDAPPLVKRKVCLNTLEIWIHNSFVF